MKRRHFLSLALLPLVTRFRWQHDDTAYIQSMIDRATAGQSVYIPPGTYRLSKSGLTLNGQRVLGAPQYGTRFEVPKERGLSVAGHGALRGLRILGV